ncbi:methionyl-tRNA formyltransferase [Parafannyhessea umbonata]|uniref:Methionyl-tRNA formyltransferase n=1 Tax=Parafannyhessea umbonata TaxID=604330 RepID=A0A6N7X914_9ACTN|nr:methionyl-tRNA formyltransferase [Parafannyhessea umbonata]MDD6566251.1 methionyl-tRNA formyltransferase [Parafannyhessea umbonata]MST60073.1 methionyl-tRNA formyltransferase [Parafannyhessea umbonata]
MRIVFMGTPAFAVPSLRALAGAHDVGLVLTRPDAVRGRGKRLEPSAVKAAATELGIDVLETKRITDDVMAVIRAAEPDVIVVAAFGCILPDAVLEAAPLGCVNVHASSLPRWRGAAPIQRAILSGDARAGVSIMRVVHDLDAGAYCRQADVEVGEKSCPQVMGELAELGARELLTALDQMADGTAVWTDQDESKVTYAKKIEKAEMLLDPAATALDNRRRVQTSLDAAPARMAVAGKGVRVLAARVAEEGVAQGEVLVRHGRVIAGCADGAIELLRVKPDGKREMEASAWAAGLHQSQLAWEHA